MRPEEICNLGMIDSLIREKQPFVAYRLPGEECPQLLIGEGIHLLNDLKELNGRRGFVIAPFQAKEACPIVLIENGSKTRMVRMDGAAGKEADAQKFPDPVYLTSYTEKYKACFHTFIGALLDKTFEKLVLSRSRTIEKEEDFSPAVAFRTACRRYIHSYVYLCYTPPTGVWLGSTPEIILSGERGEWNTVALAGTQSLQEGRLPQRWDDKNRKEQAYVASYVRSQLLSLGIQACENGPYPAYAGALSHLKTDFRFSLKDNKSLGELLKLLHPTPAVCGLPKEEAYQFIIDNEGYDRSYYSGLIGWLDPDGQTDLYVNLRCMHIKDDELTLYAGGGLLASSELNDEWLETEKKMQTMERIISQPLTTNT